MLTLLYRRHPPSQFRKVAEAGLEQVALDALLERLAAEGLIKAGGKQRTDSTHVIAAVAALNRLELAGESVRAALEALTAAHPAWVAQRICVPDFARRYGTPMTSWRPPASQAKRDELAIAYARDGYALLEAVCDSTSPAWLREIPAIDVLRRVLQQNYTRAITGNGREVIKRREKEPEGDGLPPGHIRIASPYDTDARWGVKREEFWLGYKLHVTETCDDPPPCSCRPGQPASRPAAGGRPGGSRAAGREHDRGCARLVFPNLITHVATTDATVTDNQMTGAIHDDLAGKSLTPGRHYLDSGYLSAAVVVSALTTWGIALIGPLLADTSAQARAGHGYARADFAMQAKLVALRVGQHVPAFVAGLADVGPAGARREQPVELRLLVVVGGVDVDVQPKLAPLGFVRPVEDDGGLRTAEASLRRSDLDAAVDAVEFDIAEDRAPEPGQQVRIVCVEDEFRYATCHRATLSRGPRPASYTMVRSGAAGHNGTMPPRRHSNEERTSRPGSRVPWHSSARCSRWQEVPEATDDRTWGITGDVSTHSRLVPPAARAA